MKGLLSREYTKLTFQALALFELWRKDKAGNVSFTIILRWLFQAF